jgi:DNA ligase-1
MTKLFKPMLASPADLDAVRFPIFASPKLDGIRASVVQGRLLSRTLKEIPSRYIFNQLSNPALEGLDGELIVGEPTSPTCYRDTVSGVMADNKTPDYAYHVFDLWDKPHLSFTSRRRQLVNLVGRLTDNGVFRIKLVAHAVLHNREELDAYEADRVAEGYEGVMLADPSAIYKFGRATTKGGELLKVKRFVDAEAEVIGVEEEMFNGNTAETNELGRTKRSSAQAGKVGKGSMGALIVRDLATKVEFNIGTGFTAADRAYWWDWFIKQTERTPKPVVKYKSFPIGVKDKPRHPVFLGLRPAGA